jgi:VRR-NUC domain-containing protein
MTETELLTAVTSGTKKQPGLCKLIGVRYYHPYDSRHCVPGFPDLFLVGTAGFAFRELKSDTGTMRPEQRDWSDDLRAVGIDCGIWRPRDLSSGRIRAELAALMAEISE